MADIYDNTTQHHPLMFTMATTVIEVAGAIDTTALPTYLKATPGRLVHKGRKGRNLWVSDYSLHAQAVPTQVEVLPTEVHVLPVAAMVTEVAGAVDTMALRSSLETNDTYKPVAISRTVPTEVQVVPTAAKVAEVAGAADTMALPSHTKTDDACKPGAISRAVPIEVQVLTLAAKVTEVAGAADTMAFTSSPETNDTAGHTTKKIRRGRNIWKTNHSLEVQAVPTEVQVLPTAAKVAEVAGATDTMALPSSPEINDSCNSGKVAQKVSKVRNRWIDHPLQVQAVPTEVQILPTTTATVNESVNTTDTMTLPDSVTANDICNSGKVAQKVSKRRHRWIDHPLHLQSVPTEVQVLPTITATVNESVNTTDTMTLPDSVTADNTCNSGKVAQKVSKRRTRWTDVHPLHVLAVPTEVQVLPSTNVNESVNTTDIVTLSNSITANDSCTTGSVAQKISKRRNRWISPPLQVQAVPSEVQVLPSTPVNESVNTTDIVTLPNSITAKDSCKPGIVAQKVSKRRTRWTSDNSLQVQAVPIEVQMASKVGKIIGATDTATDIATGSITLPASFKVTDYSGKVRAVPSEVQVAAEVSEIMSATDTATDIPTGSMDLPASFKATDYSGKVRAVPDIYQIAFEAAERMRPADRIIDTPTGVVHLEGGFNVLEYGRKLGELRRAAAQASETIVATDTTTDTTTDISTGSFRGSGRVLGERHNRRVTPGPSAEILHEYFPYKGPVTARDRRLIYPRSGPHNTTHNSDGSMVESGPHNTTHNSDGSMVESGPHNTTHNSDGSMVENTLKPDLTEFTCFMELPSEIRSMIIMMSLEDRRVTIREGQCWDGPHNYEDKFITMINPPSALFVNLEFRQVAQRKYGNHFGLQVEQHYEERFVDGVDVDVLVPRRAAPARIPFDPLTDTLVVDIRKPGHFTGFVNALTPEDRLTVTKLAVRFDAALEKTYFDTNGNRREHFWTFSHNISRFKNIEQVDLLVPHDVCYRPEFRRRHDHWRANTPEMGNLVRSYMREFVKEARKPQKHGEDHPGPLEFPGWTVPYTVRTVQLRDDGLPQYHGIEEIYLKRKKLHDAGMSADDVVSWYLDQVHTWFTTFPERESSHSYPTYVW